MPTTAAEATADGWTTSSSCVDGLGIMYAQNDDGLPSKDKPVMLYFTPLGQVSGVGIVARGNFTGPAVDQNYWLPYGNDQWSVSVSTRDPSQVCDPSFISKELVGDRASINAHELRRAIPLQISGAQSEGYETGSCFASMGTHTFFDLAGDGAMTWESPNLMPVVPMYDRNKNWSLNAVFFATPFVQQSAFLPNANEWEPVPLANKLMCKNFCDDACGWSDTHFWSTAHFYFSDPQQVTCEDGCTIGCCE
jgi:hypothetical protein